MLRKLTIAVAVCASVANATPPFPKESEILKDVKVAEGFEATLFSAPPQSNYPVFVSAAPDGTLYVSSDGNGSLDRKPDRGRILQLRDTDDDGRADEVKEFAKVDSPRGLVIDGDTLYVMHPPDLSAYVDKDGDGISDEKKLLVKGLAFDLKGRPADHTTNGMALGIDGWLYIAVGDFGFMEAVGSDGRKLQLRGGGVVRVRPDGSNLQLYSRGTRNILEVAVSPLGDLFSRDNTNDGGGWDIRFHHFTGFDDHGYPRLFKNFADEIIAPVSDYGGGSGCGACWIDEPGWPAAWNNLPYTSDWGLGPVFRHTIRPKGATFVESEKPAPLVRMTRSTDVDVDARGYAYVSSWKGATFNWNGPEAGYIVRISPKGHIPPKLPDFAKSTDAQLVKLLESPSHRTRMEAQRVILNRKIGGTAVDALGALIFDVSKPLASRVSALLTAARMPGTLGYSYALKAQGEPGIHPFALRVLGEQNVHPLQAIHLAGSLPSENARIRNEAIMAMARLQGLSGIWADGGTPQEQLKTDGLAATITAIVPLLGDSDPVVAHSAMQALRQLGASDACFAVIDNTEASTPLRNGALMALREIHDAKTVDGVIARLAKSKDATVRQGLLTALCRLHFLEGKWKGDSWGTRPDTRGPYYQPESWSETQKVAAVLKDTLARGDADESAFLAKELFRHRIKFNEATAKLLTLAENNASLIPIVAKQFAEADDVPSAAVALILKAASDPANKEDVLLPAVRVLAKTDGPESARAILAALSRLDGDSRNRAREAFFNSRLVENQHQLLEAIAEKADGKESMWADAALLKLSTKKVGAPEPREMAIKSLDTGWQQPKRRAQIIRAALEIEDKSRAAQIVAAVNDTDKDLAKLASEAVKRLKLEPERAGKSDRSAKVADLKVDDLLAQIIAAKGDPTRGEQIFTQAGCAACHTVREGDAPKGPFLGNIAAIYKRRDLAEAIIVPNKTIAQGFVTNVFTMKDGNVHLGFVTQEATDRIVIRTIAAQEIVLDPALLSKREKNDQSLMPPGLLNAMTVQDLANLLDWLEGLAKK